MGGARKCPNAKCGAWAYSYNGRTFRCGRCKTTFTPHDSALPFVKEEKVVQRPRFGQSIADSNREFHRGK